MTSPWCRQRRAAHDQQDQQRALEELAEMLELQTAEKVALKRENAELRAELAAHQRAAYGFYGEGT